MDTKVYAYRDEWSNGILCELTRAYAHQVSLLLDVIAEETCMHHPSCEVKGEHWRYPFPISFHAKSHNWNTKIHCYGRMAFVQVKEEDLLADWCERLEQLSPPAHPTECPELMSPLFCWHQVIDEAFMNSVMQTVKCMFWQTNELPNSKQHIVPY